MDYRWMLDYQWMLDYRRMLLSYQWMFALTVKNYRWMVKMLQDYRWMNMFHNTHWCKVTLESLWGGREAGRILPRDPGPSAPAD